MAATDIHRIIYISDAQLPVTPEALEAILATSRQLNADASVTGALLLVDTAFLQVLEGPRAAVEATFERIASDHRHYNVSLVSSAPVAQRGFSEWAMAGSTANAASLPEAATWLDSGSSVSRWMARLGDLALLRFIETFFEIHDPEHRRV